MRKKTLSENSSAYSGYAGILVVALCVVITILKEFSTPLNESSRGVILDMVFNNSLEHNYPIFGNILAKLFAMTNYFFSIGNTFSQTNIIYGFCHAIFLSSGFLLVLFYFRLRGDATFPAWCPILLLFTNPAFLSLDTYAWRQCLSLAVFIWGESITRSRYQWAGWALQLVAIVVHPGNAPLVLLYWLLSALSARRRLVLVLLLIVVVMPAAYFLYSGRLLLVPDWFPFRRILIRDQPFLDSNFEYNNIDGNFIPKYLVFIIPCLFVSTRHIFTNSAMPKHLENILIAALLPISVMNFIPGVNRMLVGIFVVVAVYAAFYIVHLLKGMSVSAGHAQWAALFGLAVFQLGMYMAL